MLCKAEDLRKPERRMEMVNVFKALGDSTRREILKLLNKGDMTAGEISDQFSMSKPAITKHLDILRNAELVTSRKQGVNVIYSVNVTVLQEALCEFLGHFDKSMQEISAANLKPKEESL